MPKRKERMALYIRESDPRLANSTTIESQTKLVRQYGEKEGYIYSPLLEFREAISAYEVPYTERTELLKMLNAAKRKEFDVLVVSEVRAIARRQVEVLVIYDILLKYDIRLETVKEKFGEDAMSKAILSLRAMFVEIEVEQSKMRMMRGRADRIAIGGAPNAHPKAAYGYIFRDTDREVKGAYEFNHKIIYVDDEGNEWSEYKVVVFIFDMLKRAISIGEVCRTLNEIGIPPAKKALNGNPHWQRGSLYRIIVNPIYMGEVWANKFNGVKNHPELPVHRPKEEWIRLPNAPAIVARADFEFVQKQLVANKAESMRNNSHPKQEVGLLRSGYIFCGVCGRGLRVRYPAKSVAHDQTPFYTCQNTEKSKDSPSYHRTNIHIVKLDQEVICRIKEILRDPNWIRERVAELKKKPAPVINEADVALTIEHIRRSMQNIYTLAEKATDDETIAQLTERMNNLEMQKRQAQSMLFDIEDNREQQEKLEEEIVKFEKWAAQVRPLLINVSYTPGWEELRLAMRILGIRVTIFPTVGDYPFRRNIDATVPEVMKEMGIVSTTARY